LTTEWCIEQILKQGWGKALRRAGMSWWSNSNSNSNNGNENRKGSESDDVGVEKAKKSEKEKKGGLGQEGKGRPPQSIAIDTQVRFNSIQFNRFRVQGSGFRVHGSGFMVLG